MIAKSQGETSSAPSAPEKHSLLPWNVRPESVAAPIDDYVGVPSVNLPTPEID